MSQKTVELYHELHEALNAREVPAGIVAPDFYIENLASAVTDKTYVGATGIREWISDTFDGLAEGARYEIEEIIADGDDFVVVAVAMVAQGEHSGVPLHLGWINVCWFQDGKATRGAGYWSRAEALKAVGLEE